MSFMSFIESVTFPYIYFLLIMVASIGGSNDRSMSELRIDECT